MVGSRAAAATALTVAWAYAQSAPGFEVASVKLSASEPGRATGVRLDGAQFTASGIPLKNLIYSAYAVPYWRISGAPSWSDEAYDIRATLPKNTSPAQINSMLQALLADRFHLEIHHEVRQYTVFALVTGKSGLRLIPSSEDSKFSVKMGRGHIELHHASIPVLVNYLANLPAIGRPVVDATNLNGFFDVALDWVEEITAPDNPSASIFSSIQELGLRLEPRKSPFDFVVIDHVERPTEN